MDLDVTVRRIIDEASQSLAIIRCPWAPRFG